MKSKKRTAEELLIEKLVNENLKLNERNAELLCKNFNANTKIQEIEAQLKLIPKWVSVADALPERDSFALCYYGGRAPIVGCYKGKGMWLCDEDNEMWVAGEEITHWMLIPERPKH